MPMSYLSIVSSLKRIPRSGWISHGISFQDVESVADHSFSTCALSMFLTDLERHRGVQVNAERVLRIATLHDMAEALTFDISKAYLSYLGKRGAIVKSEIEAAAWKHLTSGLPMELSRHYLRLQKEYVDNKTMEAQIVHAADSLDILLQIIDLRRRGYPIAVLKDLWDETAKKIQRMHILCARNVLRLIVKENRLLS